MDVRHIGRDLGVEQLGAVYESVLDYEPAYAESGKDRILLRRGGQVRKSTGSFYTPQTLTDYVVRRTLHPLVDAAAADPDPQGGRRRAAPPRRGGVGGGGGLTPGPPGSGGGAAPPREDSAYGR